MIAPLLFLGLLRLTSVVLQKNSEPVVNTSNKGVPMPNKNKSRVGSFAVSYVACFLETAWAAMVAVAVTVTGGDQGSLALAKNIISRRYFSTFDFYPTARS
ncbi:hypothetical protein [Pseudomonas sp. 91RF]|jgi:hypothetical protein|uniref:hypothetical protein n=1 Tax=Pseudomonas sp. 91RF TaxID=2292261 RepID=UPI0011C4960A|nr:hypothetical protein [Pseudomonas sp. 91RF]